MKKICSFIIITMLLMGILSSCEGSNSVEEAPEQLTYEDILKINRRQTLAEKYGSVTEYTYNKNTKDGDINWALRYEYANGKYNTIIDMGDYYKCYYYNNDIMAKYNDRFSYIVNFRENYKETLLKQLKRDTILNYNFFKTESYLKTEKGYVIEYSCKAGPEISEQLSDWDVMINDEVYVKFNLHENGEINNYSYYINVGSKKTEIVKVEIKYGEPVEFPEIITKNNTKKHAVAFYENYGSANQYREIYNIPDGFTIDVNSNLYVYDAYKDEEKEDVWYFAKDRVYDDINIYLSKDQKGLSYKEYEMTEE